MYHNGQIVHSIENNCPVKVGDENQVTAWAWTNLQGETTHYLEVNPDYQLMPTVPKFADGLPKLVNIQGHIYRYTDYKREQEYSIALPKTVEEAAEKLRLGLISPAPRRPR